MVPCPPVMTSASKKGMRLFRNAFVNLSRCLATAVSSFASDGSIIRKEAVSCNEIRRISGEYQGNRWTFAKMHKK